MLLSNLDIFSKERRGLDDEKDEISKPKAVLRFKAWSQAGTQATCYTVREGNARLVLRLE